MLSLNFPGAQVTQDPPPGSVLSQSSNITLTATLNGQTDSCSFQLVLTDSQNPEFTCIPEQNITIDPEVGFIVPDYREEANPSDNCDFDWVQIPAPNTVIFASQTIEITAVDAAGNRAWCSFIVRLTEEEPDGLEINCPGDKSATLDSNCEFQVPDYRDGVTVNKPGAVVTQDPPSGTTINSSTGIRLTATLGNQTVNCDFQLTLEDVTAPTINCLPNQWENYDPTTNFPLPDYRNLAVTSDACGIDNIQQSPAPGTNITQNTSVSLSVTDLAGNSSTCAFTVNLTQDEVVEITCPGDQEVQPTENCSFSLPDYTNMAGVNFEGAQVNQAPEPGTQITGNTTVILTATFNGKTDSCAFDVYSVDNTAPVAECILSGSYRLNQDGTLTLNAAQIDNGSSDNCGIVNMEISKSTFTTADIGEHNISLTVTDAAGNSDSCQTSISILPYIGNGGEFACNTHVVLELDESGNAVLTSQDLYN
ncbi:hypothetical protein LZ575_21790 [Antarcticibacterium sp. 1MA-6-2]|uniref:hypothetical protein n=1 Tax=Antarcticibacterium sp. 1MA-6-2 TaxID=2908210 RepID=UPI001F322576|nr:hypothetical protein [Antarcticibacterium sp. 1MA-6-2]UJH91196.1 hypothetical protein LZ575_21790 [Antarcticibacterium sp. 1MA-6-2]